MKNLIDCIVKNAIQMGSSFISSESVKNILYVGQNTNKFELKEVHTGLAQNGKKNMRPNLGFLVL